MAAKKVFIIFLTQVVSLVRTTPTTCDIRYDQKLGGLMADCSGRRLMTVPPDLPVDIVGLNLCYNYIPKLTNRMFVSFPALKSLSLSNNKIEVLEKDAFFGLHHLRDLDLTRIKYLDNGSFPRGIFYPVHQLTTLSLGGNARFGFPFPGYIFSHLSNLETLYIKNSWPFPDQCRHFNNMKKLKSLNLQSDNLQKLNNNTFSWFELSPIQSLTIGCGLYWIENCVFCLFHNLTNLHIQNNRRSFITLKDVTRSLYGLTNRGYNFNEIDLYRVQDILSTKLDTVLNRQVMGYLLDMCVEKLYLSNNRIMSVKSDIFRQNDTFTTCIKYLDLSGNYLRYDTEIYGVLQYMINLKSVDLSQNAGRFIPKHQFGSPGHSLYPSVNRICLFFDLPPKLEYLNISYIGYHISFSVNSTFRNGQNLRVLDLSHNRYLDSPAQLQGFSNITHLDISEMDIKESFLTNTDTFRSVQTLIAHDTTTFPALLLSENSPFFLLVSKLKQLDLSGNGIQVVKEKTFSKLVNVHTLNLSRNRLSFMPQELLKMPSLKYLDLSFNSINILQKQERELLEMKWEQHEHFSLNIFGNSFACACGTLDFIQWLHETKITLENKGNCSCLTEYGTMTFTAHFYNNLLPHWRQCFGQFWLTVAIFLQCIVIISLMSAFLLKKYFPKVEYQILRWLGKLEPQRWDYTYDAFICYGDKDYQWPCHCLYKKLSEKDETLELYLPDLHDPLGVTKADVIINAIRASWKLVIVVTEDLFTDEWSYFKVVEALRLFSQEGVITGRILLLYQDTYPVVKARVPDVLHNMVPQKNILKVKSENSFWDSLHEMIVSEDLSPEIIFWADFK